MAHKYRKNKALVDRFNELMPKVIKWGIDEIRQCLDLFSGSNKNDGRVLGIVMGEYTCMKTIQLWSDGCIGPKEEELMRYHLNTLRVRENKKGNGEDVPEGPPPQNNVATRKMSQSHIMNEPIFQGLQRNLELGKLQTLHLTQLVTSRLGWQSLSIGLAQSITLKRLQLNLCYLNQQIMEDLTPGLINCASLQIMDFSYNNMSDTTGMMLAKILRQQSQMRDQHIWMASLRKGGFIKKGAPQSDIGLTELHLRYNKLGSETLRTLSHVLATDEYLRVLDFRGNQITEEGIFADLIPNLKQNKTLTNLDLRENAGYSPKVKKVVALCLLRNLDRLKKSGLPTQKCWINPQVLLPVEAAISISADPHMIDTMNIDNTAEAMQAEEDKGERKSHRRAGSKVSPPKRLGGGPIAPRPATTASRKGTRNGGVG